MPTKNRRGACRMRWKNSSENFHAIEKPDRRAFQKNQRRMYNRKTDLQLFAAVLSGCRGPIREFFERSSPIRVKGIPRCPAFPSAEPDLFALQWCLPSHRFWYIACSTRVRVYVGRGREEQG